MRRVRVWYGVTSIMASSILEVCAYSSMWRVEKFSQSFAVDVKGPTVDDRHPA